MLKKDGCIVDHSGFAARCRAPHRDRARPLRRRARACFPSGAEAAGWIVRLRRRKPDVPVLLIGEGGTPAGEEVMAALYAACGAGSRRMPIDSSAAISASTNDITQSPV